MRCLNCHTVILDTDKFCPACRTPVSTASGPRQQHAKPYVAMIFLVAGAAGYNFACPPTEAVKTYGGINLDHAARAGLAGGVCAAVGGVFDFLLQRRK